MVVLIPSQSGWPTAGWDETSSTGLDRGGQATRNPRALREVDWRPQQPCHYREKNKAARVAPIQDGARRR